jgi:hypothetical protein
MPSAMLVGYEADRTVQTSQTMLMQILGVPVVHQINPFPETSSSIRSPSRPSSHDWDVLLSTISKSLTRPKPNPLLAINASIIAATKQTCATRNSVAEDYKWEEEGRFEKEHAKTEMPNQAMKRHSMCALPNRHGCDLKLQKRLPQAHSIRNQKRTFHKQCDSTVLISKLTCMEVDFPGWVCIDRPCDGRSKK